MLINLIVWSSCVILYIQKGQFNKEFSLSAMLSFTAIACICLTGWLQIKALLKIKEEGKQFKVQFSNLLNPDNFRNYCLQKLRLEQWLIKK